MQFIPLPVAVLIVFPTAFNVFYHVFKIFDDTRENDMDKGHHTVQALLGTIVITMVLTYQAVLLKLETDCVQPTTTPPSATSSIYNATPSATFSIYNADLSSARIK